MVFLPKKDNEELLDMKIKVKILYYIKKVVKLNLNTMGLICNHHNFVYLLKNLICLKNY